MPDRMINDIEAQVRKQAVIDAEIELRISRDRRRRRRLLTALSVVLVLVVAGLLVGVAKKMTTPSAGVEEFYSAAVARRDEGDLVNAAREFKRVLTLDPDHGGARWLLGLTLNDLGDGRGAEKELRQARMLGRKDAELTGVLLESLLLQRRYTEVLVETVSSTLGSDNVRLLLIQGEAQLGLAQPEKSLQTFSRAMELVPDSVPVLLGLTRISIVTGELAAAAGYLERARQLDPGRPETGVLSGRVALAGGEFESARQAFGEARPDEVTPEIALGVAQSFLAEGRPDAANEHLEDLKRTVGPVTEFKYLSSVAAIQRGELSNARTILVGLLKDRPEHVDALFLLAWVNYTRQEYRQAELSLNRILSINDNVKDARLLLATVQLELGGPDNAIKTLSIIEEQTPNDGQLLALLARAHMQADRLEEGEVYLKKAAEFSAAQSGSVELLGTERAWELKHCGSLIHYCRQCLYLRECR